MNTKQFQLRLPEALKSRLQVVADREGTTLSALIRRAIIRELQRQR